MEVIVLADGDAVAEVLAGRIAAVLDGRGRTDGAARLGVATGRSPLGAYRRLAERARSGWAVDPRTELVLVDEYLGLPPDHPAGFRAMVERELAAPLGLDAGQVLGPDPRAGDLDQECRRVDALVADRPVDLQILGIGRNGHIAFVEPGTPFGTRTHVARLAPTTRADAADAFGGLDAVPRRALTQGPATILDARAIVLVALGRAKAGAVHDAVAGPRHPGCPASVLQTHADLTVLLDPAAGGALARTG